VADGRGQIITPALLGQIRNRTRWLRTAAKREGLTLIIDATYDNEFNASSLYASFRQYLPHPALAPADSEPSSIFDLVQRRVTLVLDRTPYETLLQRVRTNHPNDWQTSKYGKDVQTLCNAATTNDAGYISSATSVLYGALMAEDVADVVREQAHTSMSRIGDAFLAAPSLRISGAPPPTKPSQPFSLFNTFCNTFSTAPGGDIGKWSERVRPLLRHFAEVAYANAGALTQPANHAAVFYRSTSLLLEVSILVARFIRFLTCIHSFSCFHTRRMHRSTVNRTSARNGQTA
jgi:hypothetical protein